MLTRYRGSRSHFARTHAASALFVVLLLLLTSPAHASVGDRLPEFRECVDVRLLSRSPLCPPLTLPLPDLRPRELRPRRRPPHPDPAAPPPPPLDLPAGVRPHVPAPRDRPAHLRLAAGTHSAVPREVALPPPPRHAGALLRAVQPAQLLGALQRAVQPRPAQHTGVVPAAEVVRVGGADGHGELGGQRRVPHAGLPGDGDAGLSGGGGERDVRALLHRGTGV